MRKTPEYRAWSGMRDRCTNPNNNRYHKYGQRGISFCDEWKSFEDFYRDLGKRPSSRHSLHRINNNLGYFKENCCWALPEAQMNATTRNFFIEYDGKKFTASQLAKAYSVNYWVLISRLKRGWSVDKALNTKRGKSLRQKAIESGISYITVYSRIKRGWPEKKALSTKVN